MTSAGVVDIRLAVLDMAGTTVDEGGAVYVALAGAIGAALGRTVAESEIRPWMGADKREAVTGLLTALRAAPSAAEVDDAFADFSRRLDAAYLSTPPTPVAGAEAAMAAMRASGVQVALTTGFPDRVAHALLASLGWEVGRTIDAVVTAEQVGAGRPSPRMIERAMALTGVRDAAAVAAAGDTVRDLAAGANAGAAAVVGVLTGSQDAATLRAGPATHVLDSVAELPALLAALRAGTAAAPRPR